MPPGSLGGKAVRTSPSSGNNATHDSDEDSHTEREAEEEEGEKENAFPDSQMPGLGDSQVSRPADTCVKIDPQWPHERQPTTESQLNKYTTIITLGGDRLRALRQPPFTQKGRSQRTKPDENKDDGGYTSDSSTPSSISSSAYSDSSNGTTSANETQITPPTSPSPPQNKAASRKRRRDSEDDGEVAPESDGEVAPESDGEVAPESDGEVAPESDGEVADTEEDEGSQDHIRPKRRKLSVPPTPQPALSTGFSGRLILTHCFPPIATDASLEESDDDDAEAEKAGQPAETVASVTPLDTANPVESSGTGVLFEPAVPTPVAEAEITTSEVQSTAVVTRFHNPSLSFSGHLCTWSDGTRSIVIGTDNVVFHCETLDSIDDLLRIL